MYKIGQAAKLLDVKPFVLRFWEGEFRQVLVPVRTPSGQRAYTEGNLATVREIKRLLYEEGLTIEGAKKRLLSGGGEDHPERPVMTSTEAESPAFATSPQATSSQITAPQATFTQATAAHVAATQAVSARQAEVLREVARELAALRTLLS